MALERNGRKYGDGRFIGNYSPGSRDFLARLVQSHKSDVEPSIVESVTLDLAWSEACPVAPDLIKQRGSQEMMHRYGEVLYWFGHLRRDLLSPEINRPGIAKALIKTRLRHPGESLGEHTKGWIPNQLEYRVFRSVDAYILPRLFVEYINSDNNKIERMTEALDIFHNLAKDKSKIRNTTELVVHFAESLAQQNCQNHKSEANVMLLKRLLSRGKLLEDHLFDDYAKLYNTFESGAPTLYACLKTIPQEERRKLNLYCPRG